MSIVFLDGEKIELVDELEPGELELDTLDGFPKYENDLEDTMKIEIPIDLEDTLELDGRKLEDTMELSLENDINE